MLRSQAREEIKGLLVLPDRWMLQAAWLIEDPEDQERNDPEDHDRPAGELRDDSTW